MLKIKPIESCFLQLKHVLMPVDVVLGISYLGLKPGSISALTE